MKVLIQAALTIVLLPIGISQEISQNQNKFPFSIIAPLQGESNGDDYGDQNYPMYDGDQDRGYENSQRQSYLQTANYTVNATSASSVAGGTSDLVTAGVGIFFVLFLIILCCVLPLFCYLYPGSSLARKPREWIQKQSGYNNLEASRDVEAFKSEKSNNCSSKQHHQCKHDHNRFRIKLKPVTQCPIEGITVEELSSSSESECSHHEENRVMGRKKVNALEKKTIKNPINQGPIRKPQNRQANAFPHGDPEESEYTIYQKSTRGKPTQDLTKSRNNSMPHEKKKDDHMNRKQLYQSLHEQKNHITSPQQSRIQESSDNDSPERNKFVDSRANKDTSSALFFQEKMTRWS